MSSGRYTAYHIYQNLSFPEAQKAGTRPYRLEEYQCPHSQRGALFQFDNMVERTHFDAAVTSCCNEPVLNFGNKPQYAQATTPMNPKDCGGLVKAHGCTVLEVHVESTRSLCAGAGARVRRIKILCPTRCSDLIRIQGGGSLEGNYGRFRSLGMEAGDVLILDYTPSEDLVDGWHNGCSGSRTFSEEFCGGYSINFTLNAGLNFPNGCGCDCCGESGVMFPPSMSIYAPAGVNATWDNTLALGSVSGSTACSGGTLTASFSCSGGGSAQMEWLDGPSYYSNGYSRRIEGTPASIGSDVAPACCGGTIEWTGTDGCGSGGSGYTIVYSPIIASAVVPASGTQLTEGTLGNFSGSGACSNGSTADLNISVDCLTNSPSSLIRGPGYVARYLSYLRYSGVHECSGCCGNGSVYVTFNNGCGGEYSGEYKVGRNISHYGYVGKMYRCIREYSFGWVYKVHEYDLKCHGWTSSTSVKFPTPYLTVSDCVASISGASAMNITGGCGSLAHSGGCCRHANNGLSGTDFRGYIYSLSGAECCDLETNDGAWVFSGSGQPCCPHT